MKGIIFAGCSFTWGQGLYYYHGLDTLREPPEDQYIGQYVRDAHLNYMKSIRFPRLVANYFNTFEVVKLQNGGCEDESIKFLDYIFDEDNTIHDYLTREKYTYNEIEYIVLQTSQPIRNTFSFTLNDEVFSMNLGGCTDREIKSFHEWLDLNETTYDEWYQEFMDQCFQKLKMELQFYESKGIKTKIICWQPDYITRIMGNLFTRSKLIELNYNSKSYTNIAEMMRDNKELEIKHDHRNFTETPKDHHPSKLCHQVIAENIIEHIETNDKIWQRQNIPPIKIL